MIMKDLFYEVLDDAQIAVDRGNWIIIRILNMRDKVILEYGPIHTNGMYEQAIATISYELQGKVVLRNKMVHQ